MNLRKFIIVTGGYGYTEPSVKLTAIAPVRMLYDSDAMQVEAKSKFTVPA
jgi:hypothetical protein